MVTKYREKEPRTRASGAYHLGQIIKQQRLMSGLSQRELSVTSGVAPSSLSRIEKGERFPSGHVLRKIAQPLGFSEAELFTLAGFLRPQPSDEVESLNSRRLDPHVGAVLSGEPVDIQRTVILILRILKSMPRR